MQVNIKELRAKLSYYMNKVEAGEQITIIRRSHVIGTISPTRSNAKPKPVTHSSGVEFRLYRPHDRVQVKQLHEQALRAAGGYDEENGPLLDIDLDNVEEVYFKRRGEFLVGILDGEVVAMGAYNQAPDKDKAIAELKRMRVKVGLQGKGIGSQMLLLLEDRAREAAYTTMLLDTWDGQPAQSFYESHGYAETHRGDLVNQHETIFYRKEL